MVEYFVSVIAGAVIVVPCLIIIFCSHDKMFEKDYYIDYEGDVVILN